MFSAFNCKTYYEKKDKGLEVTMKKYDQIRRKLIDRRDEIEGRLNKVDQDILHTNGAPNPDSGEQAIERENDDVLEALGGLARSELEKINTALERIERNEYGNCTLCKEAIAAERLKAIPFADRCINCADKDIDVDID
jgi:RNA polymerase-binding transcription factor DksA